MLQKIRALRKKAESWFGSVFPERQIYHRSNRVVHFISMSAKTQMALVIIVATAFIWVAYSTVNVVFNKQILVMQKREIAQLQNELNIATSTVPEATCAYVPHTIGEVGRVR